MADYREVFSPAATEEVGAEEWWQTLEESDRLYIIGRLLYSLVAGLRAGQDEARGQAKTLIAAFDELHELLEDLLLTDEAEDQDEPAGDHDDAGVADDDDDDVSAPEDGSPAPVTRILDAESRPLPAPETGPKTR